jgi:predicted metal-dependent enzyme (double-stranded beta helix superfamily)
MSHQRTFGGVGNRLVYENDRVRVWELRLEPGEASPVHRHDLDHLLIQIAGDKIALAPEPDTQSRYKDYLEAEVLPGEVAFVRRGGVEVARNIGALEYREIIIELKDAPD